MKAFELEQLSRKELILLILFTAVTLVAGWHVGAALILLVVVLVATWLLMSPAERLTWRFAFTWIDAALCGLLLAELISYFGSVYQPNSLFYGERMALFILMYYGVRLLIPKGPAQFLFWFVLASYAFLLCIGAWMSFNSFSAKLALEGWTDASQFKGTFTPYDLLNNEWATIALLVLPLPLGVAIFFRSQRWLSLGALLATVFVCLSVIITFSRGAYLTLVAGLVVAALVAVWFRLVSVKQALFAGVIVATTTGLLSLEWQGPIGVTMAMNKTVSQQRSTQGRLTILKNGICQAQGHWTSGLGSWNYPLVNDRCLSPREDQSYSGFSNNTYLQLLMEKGWIGLAAYGLFFVLLLWYGLRAIGQSESGWPQCILWCGVVGLLILGMRELFFSTLFYNRLVWVFTALYAGLIGTYVRPRPLATFGWQPVVLGGLLVYLGWTTTQRRQLRQSEDLAYAAFTNQSNNPTLAAQQISEAIEQAPASAPIYEAAGLLTAQQNTLSTISQIPLPTLKKAQQYFEAGLRACRYDASLMVNAAWTYFLEGKTQQALSRVDEALSQEPTNTEFWLSKAIFLSKSGDSAAVLNCYQTIARRDPEFLESEYAQKLEQKSPGTIQRLSALAIKTLEAAQQEQSSTILLARLGKLYDVNGQTQQAERCLSKVVKDMPALTRPYYHLAKLKLRAGDTTQATELLLKSSFLLPIDYSPAFALANIYYHKSSNSKAAAQSAIRYYRMALSNLIDGMPSHRGRLRFKYQSYLKGLNDLFVKDLLYSSREYVDFRQVATRMAGLFTQLNQPDLAKHYSQLAGRELASLVQDDIR